MASVVDEDGVAGLDVAGGHVLKRVEYRFPGGFGVVQGHDLVFGHPEAGLDVLLHGLRVGDGAVEVVYLVRNVLIDADDQCVEARMRPACGLVHEREGVLKNDVPEKRGHIPGTVNKTKLEMSSACGMGMARHAPMLDGRISHTALAAVCDVHADGGCAYQQNAKIT